MRQKLVAGNWKMHGELGFSKTLTETLCDGLSKADISSQVAIFPPSVVLAPVVSIVTESKVACAVGSQNIATQVEGAYTGEISAAMVKSVGCSMTLIGHSERRTLYGETDQVVAEKLRRALDSGLMPIVCVGETLDERESGITEKVIETQVSAAFDSFSTNAVGNVIIAYEPVWAIGTGKTASPDEAQQVHKFIRDLLSQKDKALAAGMRILYGGSVKPDNAGELFAQEDIDGGLIGGASLSAESFLRICSAAG
ncbi:MAG: triose-phosphate isomerase [Gammaproteobacteria bacterium]|nr:MAG: triose-phosphate isomerase [Gammaproteobacteria bacterium]